MCPADAQARCVRKYKCTCTCVHTPQDAHRAHRPWDRSLGATPPPARPWASSRRQSVSPSAVTGTKVRGVIPVLIARSPGQPRLRGSGLAVGEARSPHPGTCPRRPRLSLVPLRTSNCQWAACSSCFAWSAAQPAVSTNWLIITWCLSSSMFTDMAPPRSPLRPPCALAPRLTRPPLASRPRLIQIFTVRSDSPRLAARRPAKHAGMCSPQRPRRTDRGGEGTPFL